MPHLVYLLRVGVYGVRQDIYTMNAPGLQACMVQTQWQTVAVWPAMLGDDDGFNVAFVRT
jgi:hypothetical protein